MPSTSPSNSYLSNVAETLTLLLHTPLVKEETKQIPSIVPLKTLSLRSGSSPTEEQPRITPVGLAYLGATV